MISVTSKDRAVGIEQGITISMAGGLNSDEIERMRKEAEKNAEADNERQEEVRYRHKALEKLSDFEKGLKSNSSAINDATQKQITTLIAEVNHALESKESKKVIAEKMEP